MVFPVYLVKDFPDDSTEPQLRHGLDGPDTHSRLIPGKNGATRDMYCCV